MFIDVHGQVPITTEGILKILTNYFLLSHYTSFVRNWSTTSFPLKLLITNYDFTAYNHDVIISIKKKIIIVFLPVDGVSRSSNFCCSTFSFVPQVSQKSLVCWANTALPYYFIVQNKRYTLANPSLSLSFRKLHYNCKINYNCKIH